MGGCGSGRWGTHVKKNTVEDCRFLDASRWMRETYLQDRTVCSGTWHWTSASAGEERASIDFEINTTGAELPPYVRLHYRLTKNGENLDYNVSLATTRPDWGGLRWWFICPLLVNGQTCGRRVRKLYLPRGGKYYGCRHCHDLSYESRRNDGKYAALFKAQAIRMRLGGSPPSATLFQPNRRECGGRRTSACGSKKNSITLVTSRETRFEAQYARGGLRRPEALESDF
jgi:hypothetical protein